MTRTSRMKRPWDSLEYQTIESASYQNGQVVVRFADGAEVQVIPRDLVSPSEPVPDWPNVRAERFHLVVPTLDGEVEVPWDVIRVQSDPAFDAFWAELAAEPIELGSTPRIKRAG